MHSLRPTPPLYHAPGIAPPQNPGLISLCRAPTNPRSRPRHVPFFSASCRVAGGGTELCATPTPVVQNWKLRSPVVKNVDAATLGNLCVDIILDVPELPPPSPDARLAYMERLSSSPPDQRYWEAGGNCNMAIAAARLGLNCVTIGHVGDEIYGKFLLEVLQEEGINMVGMMCQDEAGAMVDGLSASSYETLLCWVLVDPLQRHGFCSRADFSSEPAFSWMRGLTESVTVAIRQSRILFCNGYGFDEFSPSVLISALDYASEVETSVFFDPGPRGKSLLKGTPEERQALSHFLTMSDVLLLTSDEAESLTGIGNPILAGQELLRKGIRTKWVIIKMGYRGSILVSMSSISCAPAFRVNVIDTVGCGDSFVAAIAFGYIHDLPFVNTLAIANAVGAATAMGSGAGRNVATLDKVTEILRESNINEDDEFWKELVKPVDSKSVTFLSKKTINSSNNQLNRVSIQKVVAELLPKIESTCLEGKVAS